MILVHRGIRISQETLTIDISPEEAERIRGFLICAHKELAPDVDAKTLKSVRQLADALAGPLPVVIPTHVAPATWIEP